MRVGLFLIAVLINLNICSQNSGDYPLDIPIILSSSFGELRPNHFHAKEIIFIKILSPVNRELMAPL